MLAYAYQFMTVDVMTTIDQRFVLLKNLCNEKQINDGEESPGNVEESTNSIGKGKSPFWCGLRKISHYITAPAIWSLAAFSKSQRIMENEE